jgi:GTPase SAR1 family protein
MLSHPGGQFLARLIIIGEVNAGKTTFINAAAKGKFEDLGKAPRGLNAE